MIDKPIEEELWVVSDYIKKRVVLFCFVLELREMDWKQQEEKNLLIQGPWQENPTFIGLSEKHYSPGLIGLN